MIARGLGPDRRAGAANLKPVAVVAFGDDTGDLVAVPGDDDTVASVRVARHARDDDTARAQLKSVVVVVVHVDVAHLAQQAAARRANAGAEAENFGATTAGFAAADDRRPELAAAQHADARTIAGTDEGKAAEVERDPFGIARGEKDERVTRTGCSDHRVARRECRVGDDVVAARAGDAFAVDVVATVGSLSRGGQDEERGRSEGGDCEPQRHEITQRW